MFKQFLHTSIDKKFSWKLTILALVCFFLIAAFYFSPITTGDDWETFRGASWHILSGQPLYGETITFGYYSNPPWVAMALLPVSVLPFRLGWAVICVANIAALLAVGLRWKLGIIKIALGLASPPMFYILLHGQVDMLLLAVLCLPFYLWPLAALAKPQVAIGLLFGIPRRFWLSAGMVTGVVIASSFLLFGNWPLAFIRQPQPFANGAHNFWLGLWPFQVPAGVALILLGISRREERFLVAGSPLMLPYATTSSMIGPLLAASSLLSEWQFILVWFCWWGATVYRGFGG